MSLTRTNKLQQRRYKFSKTPLRFRNQLKCLRQDDCMVSARVVVFRFWRTIIPRRL